MTICCNEGARILSQVRYEGCAADVEQLKIHVREQLSNLIKQITACQEAAAASSASHESDRTADWKKFEEGLMQLQTELEGFVTVSFVCDVVF